MYFVYIKDMFQITKDMNKNIEDKLLILCNK